jgi:signal recognition particle GTPase
MGVEQRKGNLYYYRKRRDGDRVVSEYVGGGLVVSLVERQAEIERAQRAAELAQRHAERMSLAEIDRQMDQFSNLVDSVMAAELLTLGYHQHKRQWRRRR